MNKLLRNAALLSASLLASPMAMAAIDTSWSEDFEGCNPLVDLDALGGITPATCGANSADLTVNGIGFDSAGNFLYVYGGGFPAPNNAADPAAQFSGVAVGEGGVNQGNQQLNFFNDYNNADHTNGSNNIIEAVIYKEYTIDASDLDKTIVFRFSYKSGNAVAGTTRAYIKTIEPFSGNFFVTNEVYGDTDDRTNTWVEDIEISLFLDGSIDDVNNTTGAAGADGVPDLQGQLFQVGLSNTAQNLSDSGMWYDNLSLFEGTGAADTDGDGIDDSTDNCTTKANANQVDTDNDGFGNACDGDFNNSCGTVNLGDLFAFKAAFGTADAEKDMNESGGNVNLGDLFAFKALFGLAPGPSGDPQAAITCP